MKSKLHRMISFIFFAILYSACVSFTHAQPNETQAADKTVQKMSWQQKLLQERKAKDLDFKKSPTSPMAGVKRVTLSKDSNDKAYLLVKAGKIELSVTQELNAKMVLQPLGKNEWSWKPITKGIVCRDGKKDIAPGTHLPRHVVFTVENFTISTYAASKGLVLLIFDPQRPQIQQFSHLLYFPPDAGYRVKATITRFPKQKKIKMLTSRGEEKNYYRYGELRFELDGKTHRLTAFKFSIAPGEASQYLFIPFSDATSGKDTYSVGRFLEAHEPKGNTLLLDFNRCYNPLCNYAPVYNCPIPPFENALKIPIKAGEKTYPH